MFDTIDFVIPYSEQQYSIDALALSLFNPKIKVDEISGERQLTGYLCGCNNCDLFIKANDKYLNIGKRSIAKWILGNNLETPTRKDIEQAIYRISDMLQVDVMRAKITRFDIGANIPVNKPVIQYLRRCYTLCGMSPIRVYSSIYYESTSIGQLVLYDKISEMKETREYIPPFWSNCNVLRCEQRYKHPQNVFKREIRAFELVDIAFYSNLIEKLKKTLRGINKQQTTFDMNNMNNIFGKGKKGLYKMAIIQLVNTFGGVDDTLHKIDEFFADKPNQRKAKKDIKDLVMQSVTNGKQLAKETDSLTSELNNLIETINVFHE